MPSINRGTLPQNFLDSVSSGMRLPTPEPQYWFAKAALGARMSLAALDCGMPTVQQFVSMLGAGAQLPPELDELARAADAFAGVVTAVDDFGKGQGDTVKFRRDVYSTGGLDGDDDRVLSPDASISTTGQAIQMEETAVVLKQYHGPYASSGTAVQPYAIADFDAKYKAAKESLSSATSRYLRRDYIKWLDTRIRDRFRSTQYITYSDDVTNVLSMVAGAGHVANLEMIMKARKALSDREWSKFGNGRYVCLVPTKFNTDMIGDADYRELSKVHREGQNQLFGYIGSIQDVDIFEVTTLKAYAATATVPGDGNAVPAGVTVQEGLLFGPGAVGFGTGLEPECRWADDTNYGTIAKCIWYALHAFQTLDERGVQRFLFQ
jgi:hypothetical protein